MYDPAPERARELSLKSALAHAQSAEDAAQAFVGHLFQRHPDAFVLLRLFVTLAYRDLSQTDRQFVDGKAATAGIADRITPTTPILTLLGTRGRQPEWNERCHSRRFRCLPLASGQYVGSLSMLSAQFAAMGLGAKEIDRWGEAVGEGQGARYRGTLYIEDAAASRDDQGRLLVPVQEFVADHGVCSAAGVGCGYEKRPAMVILFAFLATTPAPPAVAQWVPLVDTYRAMSEQLLQQGRIYAGR